ncbi:unnamed protein product, partial [Nesidiocoris tenuis]
MTYPLFFYVSFCAVFMATSAIGLQESADLKNDLYFLNWYDYHPSTKKAIKIMLEKMKRPIVLKAGGLAIVNWELFANNNFLSKSMARESRSRKIRSVDSIGHGRGQPLGAIPARTDYSLNRWSVDNTL